MPRRPDASRNARSGDPHLARPPRDTHRPHASGGPRTAGPQGDAEPAAAQATARMGQAVLDALGGVPVSRLAPHARPADASQRRLRIAAGQAGLAAGALALPLGPLGWLTLLPEMTTVWRIQARLVADIAALHGKADALSPEALLYCLFRHTTGSLLRDLVVRVGERSLVQRAGAQALRVLATRIGASVMQRLAGKGLARWVPVAGAVGVAAYAIWDTRQVAATAVELFSSEVVLPRALPWMD